MLTAEDKLQIRDLVAEVLGTFQPGSVPLSRIEIVAEVAARATELFGTREGAMAWLRTPVRGFNDRPPLEVLQEENGPEKVTDLLGRVEHGVW